MRDALIDEARAAIADSVESLRRATAGRIDGMIEAARASAVAAHDAGAAFAQVPTGEERRTLTPAERDRRRARRKATRRSRRANR